MAESDSNNKIAGGLVALSSAAILAIYSVGCLRTLPAGGRFQVQPLGHRAARAGSAKFRGSYHGLPAIAIPDESASAGNSPGKWKDGTYYGWGVSRHGDIQAEVVIEGGRIISATIAQCRTRYACSVIGGLPPEVAQRQSPEVDYVSGATESMYAFYYAVAEALERALAG